MIAASAISADVRCPAHGLGSVGTCSRCGAFVCERDLPLVVGVPHCEECSSRPDANSRANYLKRHWGKRDVFAWLFGLLGLYQLLLTTGLTAQITVAGLVRVTMDVPSRFGGAGLLVSAALCIYYFFRGPRARVLLFVTAALSMISIAQDPAGPSYVRNAIWLALVVAAYRSTRNRLFFREPVSDADFDRAYREYVENRPATLAYQLAGLGIVAFPLLPIAAGMALLGLKRSFRRVTPPIPNRRKALSALGLCFIFSLLWFVGLYQYFAMR